MIITTQSVKKILWCEEHSKICVYNVFVRSIENQNTCRHSSKIQKHLCTLIFVYDWKKHIWKSTREHYFNWWLFHHTFAGSTLFWNVHLIKPSVLRKNNCVVTSQNTIDRDAKYLNEYKLQPLYLTCRALKMRVKILNYKRNRIRFLTLQHIVLTVFALSNLNNDWANCFHSRKRMVTSNHTTF